MFDLAAENGPSQLGELSNEIDRQRLLHSWIDRLNQERGDRYLSFEYNIAKGFEHMRKDETYCYLAPTIGLHVGDYIHQKSFRFGLCTDGDLTGARVLQHFTNPYSRYEILKRWLSKCPQIDDIERVWRFYSASATKEMFSPEILFLGRTIAMHCHANKEIDPHAGKLKENILEMIARMKNIAVSHIQTSAF